MIRYGILCKLGEIIWDYPNNIIILKRQITVGVVTNTIFEYYKCNLQATIKENHPMMEEIKINFL